MIHGIPELFEHVFVTALDMHGALSLNYLARKAFIMMLKDSASEWRDSKMGGIRSKGTLGKKPLSNNKGKKKRRIILLAIIILNTLRPLNTDRYCFWKRLRF